MLKKVVGFILGFLGCIFLMAFVFSGSGIYPKGPLLLFVAIGAGVFVAKLADRPKATIEGASRPLRTSWWRLDQRLRMCFLTSLIWGIGAYSFQDTYDRDLRWVFVPPLCLMALYFGHRYLVAPPARLTESEESPVDQTK